MCHVFPIIIHPSEEGFWVEIPDFETGTQGDTLEECIYMARDAISLVGVTRQDRGQKIPRVTDYNPPHEPGDIVTLVDVDFDAYRRANDMRTVRKNVTLPNYLNEMAEKAGINFSQVLQEGLKQRLGVQD